MASSNRHWPSLFKSKACNAQGHHDMINSPTTLLSGASQKPSYASAGILAGCEERSPEPKPRWNPKPEQIRILEAIFNSGMVNPPREEIRRIRAQLQEYGQVGDANVFYWFQNRKSRSKQRLRHHLQATRLQQSTRNTTGTGSAPPPRPAVSAAAATSSSSSSERSTAGSSDKTVPPAVDASSSPMASVDQNFPLLGDLFPEPFYYFQANKPQNCCGLPVSEFPAAVVAPPDQAAMGLRAGLFSELSSQETLGCRVGEDGVETKLAHYDYGTWSAAGATSYPTNGATTTTATAAGACSAANGDSTIAGHVGGIVQGMGNGGGAVAGWRPTVFINEVAFEVGWGGLLNVREAFGEEAILLHASGDPVPVDGRGVTFHPLQNGASYYLV